MIANKGRKEMTLKEWVQMFKETSCLHVYELVHRNGDYKTTSSYQPSGTLNKTYWLLGDRKALEEFHQQYHNPYTGYTHI
jgi:hypothetical protein